jgi:small subunit ribosomal protein S19e
MTSVYDVPADKLILKAAEDLKTKIKAPEFAKVVKTGVSRERAPLNDDWWYVRVAATLRKYYTKEALGVNLLRGYFGGKQERGAAPAIHAKGSGKIARLSVQQLEKEGFLTKADKGRKITPKGRLYLDKFAKEIASEKKA